MESNWFSVVDIAGWVAYIVLFCGTLILQNKNRTGWAFRGTGNLMWMVLGWKLHLTSVMVWGVIFFLMDVRGYWKWR
jgi:hypothetical protein